MSSWSDDRMRLLGAKDGLETVEPIRGVSRDLMM
jgi:hypothetical protein